MSLDFVLSLWQTKRTIVHATAINSSTKPISKPPIVSCTHINNTRTKGNKKMGCGLSLLRQSRSMDDAVVTTTTTRRSHAPVSYISISIASWIVWIESVVNTSPSSITMVCVKARKAMVFLSVLHCLVGLVLLANIAGKILFTLNFWSP